MAKKNKPNSAPLAGFSLLGKTDEAAVAKLLAAAFDDKGQRTRTPWKGQGSLVEISGIGYNRAWLLVERHNMELHEPQAIVHLDQVVAAAQREHKALSAEDQAAYPFDPEAVRAAKVRSMMLDERNSWGRAMVRLNMTEGQVRRLFVAGTGKAVRDLGLRPAQKGGRFVMDKGDLYTEHRKVEGAAIAPTTALGVVRTKGTEALLNKGKVHLNTVLAKAPAGLEDQLAKGREARREAAAAKKAQRIAAAAAPAPAASPWYVGLAAAANQQ